MSLIAALVVAPATAASAVEARPIGPDADFLIAAHQANLTQMKAGRYAARKAGSATVRDLGRQFATYHRKLDGAVRKAARSLDVRLPSSPNSEQLTLLRQYRAAPAAEFDTLFVDSQLLAHRRAIKLGQIVLATGTEAVVRDLVTAVVPVARKHAAALAVARKQIGGAAEQ
ncbi:DUF4142 domain-containing protein [Actinoplanes aureus]|uniref:DUF4142 domain-containing protein n=1 Tax=Actinoplanes aureus TaxID=2792083 RepID=A0A931CF48_9ACTN|nr:DUF4142 domain-containing protein [Actinoplanes aureus]MBG0568974.1 DUF4142 domain-containing protein [Actinoplanes aureus]